MTLWLDAQLPPAICRWISETLGVDAAAVRDLGLRDATDDEIFLAARSHGAIVVTKDADFVRLLEQLGPPPSVIWLTCGYLVDMRKHVERLSACAPRADTSSCARPY